MATLSVWRVETAGGAEGALDTLKELRRQELIQVHDAAVVTWDKGRKKPKTKHLADMTGPGALGGAFWGLLFGLIFFVPLFGLAVGAAGGAIAGHFTKVGIDEDFIKRIRDTVTPGTSALFVLSSGAVQDRVVAAFKGTRAELVQTNLSAEQEQALRGAFADD